MDVAAKRERERVEEIAAIRMDGAETWDVRRFVEEKVAAGEPLWKSETEDDAPSEKDIARYIAAADKLSSGVVARKTPDALRKIHVGKVRNLYAKAVSQGDIRAALACLKAEGELEGVYEPRPRQQKAPPLELNSAGDVADLLSVTIEAVRAGKIDVRTANALGALATMLLKVKPGEPANDLAMLEMKALESAAEGVPCRDESQPPPS
jgi:hypothetical protein